MFHAEQQIDNLKAGCLVQIPRRLVRDQQSGVGRERPCQRNTLLLAARQLSRIMIEPCTQADLFEFTTRAAHRIGMTGQFEGNGNILERCHCRNQVE